MTLFMNISNFIKWKNIYIITFSIAHWNTLDGSLRFCIKDIIEHTNEKYHMLPFSVQVIDILKHNDAKCHLSTWVAITMYFGG
jgi:hypothetical protein